MEMAEKEKAANARFVVKTLSEWTSIPDLISTLSAYILRALETVSEFCICKALRT
jgi:hypothetical protein